MVVGISTMIFSFRTTVEQWLNRSIQSDLVIAPAANLLVGNREFIRPEVERIVTALPHVKVDSFRELRVLSTASGSSSPRCGSASPATSSG